MLSFLHSFFSNLTGAQRLAALILLVALSTTLLAFFGGGWKTGIPVGVLILAIIWLTSPLWKPSEPSRTRIALSSLGVISAVALAVAGKTPEAKPALARFLINLGLAPEAAQKLLPLDHTTSALVLSFVLAAVLAINWLARDRSAMRKHPTPLDEDFPEQTYRQQLKRYSEVLGGRLATLDEETKWDDYFFAPLEAEVEVISGRESRKKIVDLMTALRADRTSRIILVLGDPGSGKSIALRKLAKDLLKEVESTGRLPVYVNLKEWDPGRIWTEEAPPTRQDLREFILRTLSAQSIFADQFLQNYFDKMLDRGRFFFLLDSFDEIPAVLDVTEASWLVQHLSMLMSEFFVGQDGGRGVVASRSYRRPKFNRAELATFEIRPFTDLRIHEALMRSGKLRQETVDRLFTVRTELIPVARNPFSLALIRLYAETHAGALPSNQLEMFEAYIQNRLDESEDVVSKYGLDQKKLAGGATDIAWCMFQAPEIGLEAPLSRLVELLPGVDVQSTSAVLRYAGLARLSSAIPARFSFVHRRLNEYFVARRLLDNPTSISLQSIPLDSRYRDALALYCEVGDKQSVSAIATFCWDEIIRAKLSIRRGIVSDDELRAIHCLRFLRDAFRTRPDCVPFQVDLAEHVEDSIRPNGDILAAKLALEATGLLPESLAEPILIKALKTDNAWLGETALHACRHLKRISEELDTRVYLYLARMSVPDFLRRYKEITFSLALSDAFRGLRRYCVLRSIDNKFLVAGLLLCAVLMPSIAATVLLFVILQLAVEASKESPAQISYLSLRTQAGSFLGVTTITLFIWGFHPSWSNRYDAARTLAHGSSVSYILIQSILVITIVPWLDATIFVRRFGRKFISSLFTEKLIILAGAIALMGLVWFATFWIEKHWKHARYFFFALAIFGLAPIAVSLFSNLIVTLKDRKYFPKAKETTSVSRAAIADDFTHFRTQWYRMKYVNWLRESQVRPHGSWPNGRPNVGDEASTMLAQLDERWLGLEV
jgi:hypothetical protein